MNAGTVEFDMRITTPKETFLNGCHNVNINEENTLQVDMF